jgi:hypothetical protein
MRGIKTITGMKTIDTMVGSRITTHSSSNRIRGIEEDTEEGTQEEGAISEVDAEGREAAITMKRSRVGTTTRSLAREGARDK